jgi:hypothetical protein
MLKIIAACLTVACNAERVVVCEFEDDALICAETRPVTLISSDRAHVRRPGGPSMSDHAIRYRAR